MKTLRRTAGVVLARTSDVVGTLIATVIVFVLFSQEYQDEVITHQVELYILMTTLIVANLLAPAISHKVRHQRLYSLSFFHLVWILLLLLSQASGGFVVSINLGLIILTSLWLNPVAIIASSLLLSAVLLRNRTGLSPEIFFMVGSQLLLGIFLVQRHMMRARKAKLRSSEFNEALVERERLQSLINSMADGVIATDENGRVVLYNGAALDTLNINVSLKHKYLGDFMDLVDSNEKKIDIFERAKKARAYFVSRDYRLKVSDEEFMNVFTSIAPVRIGYGKAGKQGYIMLIRDITREKSLEEERDEFISVVSHELRTPITIAEGSISNVKLLAKKSKRIDETMRSALDDAHQQVIFLAEMISDLSTLSRAERGVLHVEPETVDPLELVENVVHNYKITAEQKNLKLRFKPDESAAHIITSRLYVREILQNFITNAVKYTEKGSITVALKAVDDHTIKIIVSDTGIGVSKSDQRHLFKKFFRSEDYRTRKNSGTGLGLYVTMKLAKLIKATIEIDSQLNKGSTFSITIPTLKKKSLK